MRQFLIVFWANDQQIFGLTFTTFDPSQKVKINSLAFTTVMVGLSLQQERGLGVLDYKGLALLGLIVS